MAKTPRNGETTENQEIGGDAVSRDGDGPQMTSNKVDLEGTRDVVQDRIERRSAKNEEGHAKNMKEAEDVHKDSAGKVDPKLGREDNGNTPIVNPDGSKTWTPPGVAGAAR